jgi:solute carrier family 35 protein E1
MTMILVVGFLPLASSFATPYRMAQPVPHVRSASALRVGSAPTANLLSSSVAQRVVKYIKGDDISMERVPCGDDEVDECYALCDSDGCEVVGEVGLMRTLKIGLYFALWFGLSTGYNIQNKVRLNLLPLPWTQSAFSLFVGTAFVMPLWLTGIRKPPKLSGDAIRTLLPIAFCHAIGHIGAVVSAGAGAVSFTQIVKAAEPVFTCGLSALILGSSVSALTALSLIPIVAGVALASVSELSFTWLAFGGAMLSNLAFATRNIFSRLSMDKPKGENMTPENLFGVLTVMSFLFALPLALIIEGPTAAAAWSAAALKSGAAPILKASIATGLYFYTYNEIAMLALNNVHPVTHAVANTIKRVVILLACVIFFRTPMTPLCQAGSAIAIGGSYLYSVAKGKDKLKKTTEAKD